MKKLKYIYHECPEMGCRVIRLGQMKDNKEPCQFCGTEKWKLYREA